jgi:hypothetical protein
MEEDSYVQVPTRGSETIENGFGTTNQYSFPQVEKPEGQGRRRDEITNRRVSGNGV